MLRIDLKTNWNMWQHTPGSEPPAEQRIPASVPGNVHQDLLRAGLIPNPFVGLNETTVQWVGDADWMYTCTFDVPSSALAATHIDLCFDGLDTFATVWLNGAQILTGDNMFVPARVPVKQMLKASGNVLQILFESAMRRGREVETALGPNIGWNGDTSRLHVRKAQYHYGWDWGPSLVTAGPWRPIYLEAYDARIEDVDTRIEVSDDLRRAILTPHISLDGVQAGKSVQVTLVDPAGQPVKSERLSPDGQTASTTFSVDNPSLWYPNGYGQQPRYRLEVTLLSGDTVLDTHEQRLGIRRLSLVQEPLDHVPGTTFLFEINNIPVFCGGANWIPADSFTPRVTAETYRRWLQLAADANMVMLRVWGGGIYEEDVFYDLCDELGLLVWQDFMFACGLYPAHPTFQQSVRAEAEATVRRLRHHPSLALWCGNNEDYQVGEAIQAYDPALTSGFESTRFPARALYEQLLPAICARLDPSRPYWPGSPYGGQSVFDPTIGDKHTWEVWHGNKADYRDYPKYAGRFVSEFGMQAFPDLSTIETFAHPDDRSPDSRVMNHHNKAGDGPERLRYYVDQNVMASGDFETYIYSTQFVQSEAVAAGIEGWRRQWKGPGQYEVAGALVWQLNDCWPVISWALADYTLKPKPAYYRTKRVLAPIALGTVPADSGAAVWAVNSTLEPVTADLDVQVWTLTGSQISRERRTVSLLPNRSTELGTVATSASGPVAVSVRLVQDQTVLARVIQWPEPPKSAVYPDPSLHIRQQGADCLQISVERPARGVYLSGPAGVVWSDNMLDLVPGDPQEVHVAGLRSLDDLRVRWLGGREAVQVNG